MFANWLHELAALAERFSCTGVIYDLANMSMDERYGALLFLRRLAAAN